MFEAHDCTRTANAGKTLFTLNFAAYLDLESVTINFTNYERGCYSKTLSIAEAITIGKRYRSYTRDIQTLTLTLPWEKEKQFELVDTTGLTDGINHDEEIRRAMAQTLRFMRQADIIFISLIVPELQRLVF